MKAKLEFEPAHDIGLDQVIGGDEIADQPKAWRVGLRLFGGKFLAGGIHGRVQHRRARADFQRDDPAP
ncbi:MAG: hypothetical protein ACMUJK_14815 [Rhodobacterales bacterium]